LAILTNVGAILMVVLGLGFVIFIHELGHFLLAKWNGVKVEKFAIGFDPYGLRLWQKQVGETTYVVGALPLGGYVKMLGEEPSEASETAGDPRAYHNKPVGSRMAIISAGVVMNVLFGVLCFTYVHLRGRPEMPAVVGSVLAGMPAYDAGLRPGDRVLRVDGRPIRAYTDLQKSMIFSGKDQRLTLEVERPGEAEPRSFEVTPRLRPGALGPTIGLGPALDLELSPKVPYLAPAGFSGEADAVAKALAGGGRVVAAGLEGEEPRPIGSKLELDRLLEANADRPIVLELRAVDDAGKLVESSPARRVVVPPAPMADLGLVMEPGVVVGLRPGSVASAAGLRHGDRIVAVDGDAAFDPMRLPDLAYRRAREGGALQLTVTRAASDSAEPDRMELEVAPAAVPPSVETTFFDEALDVPALGLALEVTPRIAAIRPGSPAERSGLKAGDVVRFVELTRPALPAGSGEGAAAPETIRLVLDGKRTNKQDELASWPGVFDQLQALPRHEVSLTLAGGSRPLRLTPEPVEGWPYPRRGLRFVVQIQPMPPLGLGAALGRAWGETVENAASVYYMIRGLFQRTLPADSVGGPIKIADWAYTTARAGLDAFIPFLGMLSINLAVVNFLPIPPLDGGQMLFLIAEKIRGRPLPERLAGPVMIAGLLFILLLFVVVNVNDVMSLLGPGR
jgi:regulator of sigma E protease